MNDLAASIGLAKLKKLILMNKRRSEKIKKYLDRIKAIDGIVPLLPFEPKKYVYQMFGIRADKRDNLMIYLKSKGIATGCHYTPLSIQPLFKKWGNSCLFIEKEIINFITLPLHADLTNDELDYVIKNLKK